MNPLRYVLGSFKVLGIVFMCLLLASVWLTYAIFTKQFTDYDDVYLQTSKIGLQMPTRADVKIRGVQVGEVLAFDSNDDGARLTLGIYPGQRDTIPANVTGSIVPKTLFGEKYVSLIVPDNPDGQPVEIEQTIERTRVSTEVEEVLSDLYPLLRAVQPAELNSTLNALATALEGRGDQLGENLETVDLYLKRMNPLIPELVEDLRLTSDVADTYSDVLPELATILRDTVKTTGTLEGREVKLNALFKDVGAFSDTTRTFLEENGDNIIRLGEVSEQQLTVLAKYAPEYPCLLDGIVRAGALQAQAFRNFTLHIVLETLPNQPRGYTAADKPRYGDTSGPHCGSLPVPAFDQSDPFREQPDFDDGIDEPTGKGTSRVAPGFDQGWAGGYGYAGSPEESTLLKELMGPALGSAAADVPDLGVLLLGPMARGARVGLAEGGR